MTNTALQINTEFRSQEAFIDCHERNTPLSKIIVKKENSIYFYGDLDNSIKFNKYLRLTEKAKRKIDRLWEKSVNHEKLTCKRKYRPAFECLIANLKLSYNHEKYISISLNKNNYPAGNEIPWFKYDFTKNLINKLEEEGLIHKEPGYYDRDSGIGRYTRIWATKQMIDLLTSISIQDIFHDIKNPIKLRKTKSKEEIRLNKLPNHIKQKSNVLLSYNKFISNQLIEYIPINDNKDSTSQAEKKVISGELFASYNRGETAEGKKFRYGGRLYNVGYGHQLLSKDERGTIRINGVKTVEIDYSALHINMLYAQKNIQYNSDPYKALTENEDHRIVYKKFLLTLLNASNIFESIGATQKDIKEIEKKIVKNKRDGKKSKERDEKFLKIVKRENFDWYSAIQKIKEVHSPIADYICSDMGTHLMNIDSKIILDVIMHFTNKGIPCLPVHDSVIIAEKHQEELKNIMQEVYKKHMNGFTCSVK